MKNIFKKDNTNNEAIKEERKMNAKKVGKVVVKVITGIAVAAVGVICYFVFGKEETKPENTEAEAIETESYVVVDENTSEEA